MPPVEDIALRVPRADEIPRLREYLPVAFLPGGMPSWLIAERASASEWLGAWCLLWTNPAVREAGFFWRIDHPALAEPMLQRMLQAASSAGVRRLARMQMIWEDSAERALLEAQGFGITHEVRWHEGRLPDMARHVERGYEALRRRGRLPALEIQDLGPSNYAGTRDLVISQRLVPEFEFPHKWDSNTAGGYHRGLSFVLGDGEHVRAAFLATVNAEGVVEIEVRIVDPSDHHVAFGGNAMLLHEACQRAARLGFDVGRFRSHAVDHKETANLAARVDARFLGRQYLVVREF